MVALRRRDPEGGSCERKLLRWDSQKEGADTAASAASAKSADPAGAERVKAAKLSRVSKIEGSNFIVLSYSRKGRKWMGGEKRKPGSERRSIYTFCRH